ncbi:hypothetical protein BHM03_00036691 [Ensete ventricosum]|uniref:Uncharacterized protein n=1 Tax=Ensete ventricosum TaxID=4639 RepID=A0A445MJM7_ENSVE|nr:hypothetical protein BHM03_00036691 [Ensete ventricosum]
MLPLRFPNSGIRAKSVAARASPQGAAAHKGGACGQKRRSQGLPLAVSKGGARPRLVRRGATLVEVPPVGAEPTAP